MNSSLVYDSGCSYMIMVMMEVDSGFNPQTLLLLPCYRKYLGLPKSFYKDA